MIHKNEFDGNLVHGGKEFHLLTKRDNIIVDKKFPHYEYVEFRDKEYYPKKEYFAPLTNCPICQSQNIQEKLRKDGLIIYQCNDCTFGFQNPRFRFKYLSGLYAGEYSLNGAYLSDSQNTLDEIKFKFGIQEVKKYTEQLDSVLDIGAGNLQFLNTCKNLGISNLYGIEPGSTLGKSNRDIHVITEFSEQIPPNLNGLSLITMWDTLEHIHGFKKLVKQVVSALKKGGFFLVFVPNLNSLASRLIREKSNTFCIYHLNYFTELSLSKLLTGSGLEILQKETLISEIDNCRNYLEFKEPYMSKPSNDLAFSWLTPEYLHNNMLGSRLFFIAKKK